MKLDFIKNAFDNLQTELSQDGETITIFNPYSKGNITIDYEFYESTDGLDSFEQIHRSIFLPTQTLLK